MNDANLEMAPEADVGFDEARAAAAGAQSVEAVKEEVVGYVQQEPKDDEVLPF